jgi:acyl-CoA thioesterase II
LSGSAADLLDLLELEDLDVDLFRGRQPVTERQRVFGGQVAAQGLVAAGRTVAAEFSLHSLHSYFLRPGDPAVPIIYDVERIRDGRSFVTRRVMARQHGRPIYYLTCSFQLVEEGLDHQELMPEVPGPDQGYSMADLTRSRGEESGRTWQREWSALDVRHLGVSGVGLPIDPAHPAEARMWVRVDGELPEEPLTQQAAFLYATDLTLLGAALVPHGIQIDDSRLQAASLDHTVWFHRPVRADRWWLYDQRSPSAHGGRGLSLANVFAEDGALVATVAQEGLIRLRG